MSNDQDKITPDLEPVIERERNETLSQLEEWLEVPVMVLGAAWLILLVIDLTWGLSPFLNTLVYFIWGVFIVEFLVRFLLAPKKWEFLTRNWLTVLSLLIPALRIGRIASLVRLSRAARAARAVRSLRLVRVVSSINRGMRALRRTMRQRGFGYVVALTAIVVLAGAAGIYAFEQAPDPGSAGLDSYGEALWWTSMILTTMGSDYWPQSAEGRLLALLLSLYSFAVFGYVTASLATFFIGRDAAEGRLGGSESADQENALAALQPEGLQPGGMQALRAEMSDLRAEISALRLALNQPRGQSDENASNLSA